MDKERLLEKLNQYVEKLVNASVWPESKESIPFFKNLQEEKREFYIYELYCYIRIAADLKENENYQVKYIPGKGNFLHKFPKAPADKKGKPRFHVLNKNGKQIFQVCAGTKIRGRFDSENCHPDISFQKGNASEDPSYKDLIMIHDAKFQQDPDSTLRKEEVYKFATIVRIYDLNNSGSIDVEFNRLKGLEGNCLLTNVKGHPQSAAFLKSEGIKEAVKFNVDENFKVIP
jgi:hypothetical protein